MENPHKRNLEFLVIDVARLVRREFDRRVKSMNLTRSQWWVLVNLIRSDGCNQTQLADDLDVGKVALGSLLDRLEAKGWIERRPDPNDRRAKRVFLTPAVKPVIGEMEDRAKAVHLQLTSGMDEEDQKHLVDILLKAKENLHQDDADYAN